MMGNRSSIENLIPGNPLGSILRETAREARRSTRGDIDAGCCDDVAALQSTVAVLQAQLETLQGVAPLGMTIIRTNAGGTGQWNYPVPNPHVSPAIPIIQGTPIATNTCTVTLFTVTQTFCTFAAWHSELGTGFPNVPVLLIAYPSNLVP